MVPKICKYEFDTGNGSISMVIWSQKCANMNLILGMACQCLFGPKNGQVGIWYWKWYLIGYLVPKLCKYEFDAGNGMYVVIWSQECEIMNLTLEMVCQWLFGPKNVQIWTWYWKWYFIDYLVQKMCK